jgi:hypothetical protein
MWLGLSLGLGALRGGGVVRPTAPILTLVGVVGGVAEVSWEIDDTIAAGDRLHRQVRVSGLPDWSVLVDDTTHTLTAGEDLANMWDGSASLPAGSYDEQGFAIKNGVPSLASNMVTFTIPASGLAMDMSDFRNVYILLN